jgi:8-oxo-dGTP pyrophosphatase MutT (NUDIX family)
MLKEVVEKYLELFPDDRPKLKLLLEQLTKNENLDDRLNFKGHIAGDGIVLSPDKRKVLFIYHLRFNVWQQPGGHWDKGEEGPWLTAEREVIEETGVEIGRRIGPMESDYKIPLHIVTGSVPPSKAKNEPTHWHHDFRYGFIAESENLGQIQDDGIKEAKWFKVEDALKMEEPGHETLESIRRMMKLLS